MKTTFLKTFAAVSAVLLMTAAGAFAQSLAYSNAITSLNPAGYWPMHEVGPAAPGDIETNYGSLGVLGDAYYPDFEVDNGAFIRQWPGPLANGADKAVYFTNPNSNNGGFTNSLFVPHTSPLTTLRVPFTIEMWFMFTNLPTLNFQNDIISQASDSRLGGFRVYYQHASSTNEANPGFNLLLYNNNTANQGFQVTVGAFPTNVWHYLVYTIDTNRLATGYLDGRTRWSTPSRTVPDGRFDPDPYDPLTIGNGLGNKRGINGPISEVAIYTNALSLDQITNHWAIGTNASAGASAYFDAVTNDHPILYYRMDSAPYSAPASNTWPVVNNYGQTNGVPVGDGVYSPGTPPGAAAATDYNGYPFGLINTNVAPLSGVSSYADVGYADAYNPMGTTPFTVSAVFRGNPTDTNRAQIMVGHGTNSWQLGLTQNGYIVFNSGTNSADVVATGTAAGDLVSTTAGYDDGSWHQVVAVHNGTTNVLYVDGVADNMNVVAADNVGNSLDVMIGSDPNYTYNPIDWGSSVAVPVGVGAQFAGQICDVAFFTNALTAAQIQTLYDAIGVPATITSGPVLSRVGGSDVFTVTATGSSPAYQWYYNTVSNYSGATALTDVGGVSGSTTPSVTINNLQDYYFVVVTNGGSSVTSSIVQVPQLLTALSAGKPIWNQTSNSIVVTFSDAVDPVTAATAGNYGLDNGASVSSAALVAANEVVLTSSALDPSNTYTLTVQNVQNYYGVTQTPASTNLVLGVYPANLALWVRADTGVSTNGDGTVSQWDDMSGNSNTLWGGDYWGFTDPLLTTNAWGDPAVYFNSTNGDYGSALYANDAPSLRITRDMSIIAVVNFMHPNFGGADGEIVSKTGSYHPNVPAPYDYYCGWTGAHLYRGNGNTPALDNYGQFAGSGEIPTNAPQILAVSETGNTVTHYLNGTVTGSGLLAAGGYYFDITNCADGGQPLFVGGRFDFVNNHLTGYLSELIIAGSAISSYDVDSLGNYLREQHNLPIQVNTNPTNLVFSVTGNQLTLSWPADYVGWTLQAQTNNLSVGISTNWVNVSGSEATNRVIMPMAPTNDCVFYRLIYPAP